MGIVSKIFGTYSSKEVKRIMPIVDKINGLEDEIKKLSDEELQKKTNEFKKRLQKGETLDDILPEAFAITREASKRVLGMRHFDVQLIGGIILHQGRISEMKTGEGKTLVATLPVYLNALTGRGVHVITVNDYLARRDSQWMGKLYKFLGLSVGLVVHGQNKAQKAEAYTCDITYGTNNEYGFDYLRDNMVTSKEEMVQRELEYAIVDEIDSILIDEARTPLIISGMAGESSEMYKRADGFVRRLKAKIIVETDDKKAEETEDIKEYDYVVDLKAKSATLTEKGTKKAEDYFGVSNLNDADNTDIVHYINNALKAHGTMKNEREYVVNDGEVIIVDEFTGRLMYGRRYSDGLHQAIEAKEGVRVENESKTLATITFQNYFRMYKKLSGMTGTAMTEEGEFRQIYKLDVIEIPTNKPMIRKDNNDVIYKNEKGKFRAVVNDIKESVAKGQPVLVGTISIEKSEELASMLKKEGVRHEVLNAKYHEKEAEIIAQAGKVGAVTIATNMAGRGTDIVLGGNAEFLAKRAMKKDGFSDELINEATGFNETNDEEILKAREAFKKLEGKYEEEIQSERKNVIDAGGLKIIGTERHESRRIDNQLRGRSGRQGDPGESRFYISLEDDLMKLFGGDMVTSVYNTLKADEDMPIQFGVLSSTIENAQKKIEGRNFSIRKHVLEYDDVMNTQRELIYKQRRQVLEGENIKDNILKMVQDVASNIVTGFTAGVEYSDDWDYEAILKEVERIYLIDNLETVANKSSNASEIIGEIIEKAEEKYDIKEKDFGEEKMRILERMILLKVVDDKWMDHIDSMDQLKNGIGLRAYGQRDPVVEYRLEGYEMFDQMIETVKEDVTTYLMHAEKAPEEERTHRRIVITSESSQTDPLASPIDNSATVGPVANKPQQTPKKQPVINTEKVGRNDPCPCGSGLKYKKCCGKGEE